MKTVIIWDDTATSLQFCVVDGDKSHLNGVYINEYNEDEEYGLHDELSNLIYTEVGTNRNTMLECFPTEEVLNGAIVIVAGFIA